MNQKLILSMILFIISMALPVFAEPSCDIDKDKEKLYRLDLTVPATFCKKQSNDPSCKVFPKKSILQLHGLWPNYKKGFPEGSCDPSECKNQNEKLGKFCKYPEPGGLYNSNEWKKLSEYMAGTEKCVERHEWVKHGVCSPLDPVSYFKWALENTRDIAKAFESLADKTVGKQEVDAVVASKLPNLNGAVRLSCKGENVSSVYILYEWGNQPGNPIKTKGGQNGYGNCPKQFTFPSKPND